MTLGKYIATKWKTKDKINKLKKIKDSKTFKPEEKLNIP